MATKSSRINKRRSKQWLSLSFQNQEKDPGLVKEKTQNRQNQ